MNRAGQIIDWVRVECERCKDPLAGGLLLAREYVRVTGTPDSSGSWGSRSTTAEIAQVETELAETGEDAMPTEQQWRVLLSSPSEQILTGADQNTHVEDMPPDWGQKGYSIRSRERIVCSNADCPNTVEIRDESGDSFHGLHWVLNHVARSEIFSAGRPHEFVITMEGIESLRGK